MAAYIVADVEVQDPKKFEEYRARVPASLAPYGGRFIVRGGKVETLEGTWSPSRIVVLEFPSVERAKAWWDSEEYAEPKRIRRAASRGQFIVVEGV